MATINYDGNGIPKQKPNEFGQMGSGQSSTISPVDPNSNQIAQLSPAAKAGDAASSSLNPNPAPITSAPMAPMLQPTQSQQLTSQANQQSINLLNNPMGGQTFDQYKQAALDKSRNDWAKAFESTRQQYGDVGGSGLLQKQMLNNVLQHNVDEGSLESTLNQDYVNNMAKALASSQGQQSTNENIFNNRLNAIKTGIASGAASVDDMTNALQNGGINATKTDLVKDAYNKRMQDYALRNPDMVDPVNGKLNQDGIKEFNNYQNLTAGTTITKPSDIVPIAEDGTPKYKNGELFVASDGNIKSAGADGSALPVTADNLKPDFGRPVDKEVFDKYVKLSQDAPQAFSALLKNIPKENIGWSKSKQPYQQVGQIINLPDIGVAYITRYVLGAVMVVDTLGQEHRIKAPN